MDAAIEQQKDIGKAFREIADLRGEVREIRTALVGIDGQNGLRGEVRAFMLEIQQQDRRLEDRIIEQEKALNDRLDEQDAILQEIWSKTAERVQAVEKRLEHYLEVEREDTCIGKKFFDEHLYEDHVKPKQEEAPVKVAKIQSRGQIVVNLLTLLGILGTALIALLKP